MSTAAANMISCRLARREATMPASGPTPETRSVTRVTCKFRSGSCVSSRSDRMISSQSENAASRRSTMRGPPACNFISALSCPMRELRPPQRIATLNSVIFQPFSPRFLFAPLFLPKGFFGQVSQVSVSQTTSLPSDSAAPGLPGTRRSR